MRVRTQNLSYRLALGLAGGLLASLSALATVAHALPAPTPPGPSVQSASSTTTTAPVPTPPTSTTAPAPVAIPAPSSAPVATPAPIAEPAPPTSIPALPKAVPATALMSELAMVMTPPTSYPIAPERNIPANQSLPPRDSTGRFVTLNSNVNSDRAFWHMRIGLNVAAIGCRGESALVKNYNRFVSKHGRLIRRNEHTIRRQLGKATQSNGIAARDQMSTKLFNYFAQPPVQTRFCQQAQALALLVADSPARDIVARAPEHLAFLDQPFVEFYEAYSAYRRAMDDWNAYNAYYQAYYETYPNAPKPHSTTHSATHSNAHSTTHSAESSPKDSNALDSAPFAQLLAEEPPQADEETEVAE